MDPKYRKRLKLRREGAEARISTAPNRTVTLVAPWIGNLDMTPSEARRLGEALIEAADFVAPRKARKSPAWAHDSAQQDQP